MPDMTSRNISYSNFRLELIAEEELPLIYQEKSELLRKAKQHEEVFMGRGARDRGEVVYTDGLTDDQWVQVRPP